MSKFREILSGWTNYVFDNEHISLMAHERAKECGKCEHSKKGTVIDFLDDDVKEIQGMYCELCDCPLSALLRSPSSKCKADKWQPKTL